MKSEKEESFCSFFVIAMRVHFFNLKDFCRTVFRYYRNIQFAKVDFRLLLSYFWISPYRLSRMWASTSGFRASEIYGESPLTTMALIAKEAKITADDVVYELGSGRGRTCFWLSFFIHCKVCGVECNPAFVKKASDLKEKFHVANVKFIQDDLTKIDLNGATVVYLYVITLSDEDIKKLTKNLSKLQKGARIVTISFPLEGTSFKLIKEFDVEFAWGKTSAYQHVLV
jgi:precorrin-6B methylase 2